MIHFTGNKEKFASLISLSLILLLAIVFTLINPLLNGVLKGKLVSAVNSSGGSKLNIGRISYDLFKNSLSADNISFIRNNQNDSTASTNILIPYIEINNVNWLSLLFGTGLSINELKLEEPFIRIINTVKETEVKNDSLKNQSEKEFESNIENTLMAIIPDMLQPLSIDRLILDYAGFVYKEKKDQFTLSIDSISNISIIVDRIVIDSTQNHKLMSIAENLSIKSKGLLHRNYTSKYELRLDSVSFSTNNSTLIANRLQFQPYVDDSTFYRGLEYGKTRYKTRISKIKLLGFDLQKLFEENLVYINKTFIDSFLVDILVNKRFKRNPHAKNPKMPHELISSLKQKLRIDSIHLSSGIIKLVELFPFSQEPAVLPFTELNAVINDLTNYEDSINKYNSTQINASAKLADAGKLSLVMNLDLLSSVMSFRYKGKLDSMDITELNDFLKLDARVRIKTGNIKSVNFSVEVDSGYANGNILPVYDNLEIELLNKDDLDSGIIEEIKSFFANNLKLYDSNPDNGELRTGSIIRKHREHEPFFRFVWFSIRDGLGDVVGF